VGVLYGLGRWAQWEMMTKGRVEGVRRVSGHCIGLGISQELLMEPVASRHINPPEFPMRGVLKGFNAG
jgi:hypothetical protein